MKTSAIVGAAMMLASYAVVDSADAATVAVFGDRYDINTINTFYDALADHTSTIITALTDATLAGVDLLWAVQPADAYTEAEIDALAGFLDSGGRIAFMGEHGTYAPAENSYISAALAALGSTMSIINQIYDPAFRIASVDDGQILSDPLLEGVETYSYAAFAPLVMGDNGIPLIVGEDDPSTIMMGFENVGAGSIFLITDQNVWDNVYDYAGNDNARMFENLLTGNTSNPENPGPSPVPLPAGGVLLLTGLAGLTFARRHRK